MNKYPDIEFLWPEFYLGLTRHFQKANRYGTWRARNNVQKDIRTHNVPIKPRKTIKLPMKKGFLNVSHRKLRDIHV